MPIYHLGYMCLGSVIIKFPKVITEFEILSYFLDIGKADKNDTFLNDFKEEDSQRPLRTRKL